MSQGLVSGHPHSDTFCAFDTGMKPPCLQRRQQAKLAKKPWEAPVERNTCTKCLCQVGLLLTMDIFYAKLDEIMFPTSVTAFFSSLTPPR